MKYFKECKGCKPKQRWRIQSTISKSEFCLSILKQPVFHNETPNNYRFCFIKENKIDVTYYFTLAELLIVSSCMSSFVADILMVEQDKGKVI